MKHVLAQAFSVLAIVLGIANLLLVATRSFGPEPLQQLARAMLSPSAAIATWIVGIALVFSAASIIGALTARAARLAVIGASVYAATSFAGFEIGKAVHDPEMRQFFLASGFPVWFMYLVMGVESAAAIALLFDRTRLPAAATLVMVMLGAIGTHWHNGDPWSDSSDAIRMLLLAASICLSCSSGRPGET